MREGDKVRVYRNIRKGVWSVKVGREKVRHVDRLNLRCCKLTVSKAGWSRVLSTKQKNVHAYVIGMVAGDSPPDEVTQAGT